MVSLSFLKDINFSILASVCLSHVFLFFLPSSLFFGLLIPGICSSDDDFSSCLFLTRNHGRGSHDFLVSLMAILVMGMIIITHTSLFSSNTKKRWEGRPWTEFLRRHWISLCFCITDWNFLSFLVVEVTSVTSKLFSLILHQRLFPSRAVWKITESGSQSMS